MGIHNLSEAVVVSLIRAETLQHQWKKQNKRFQLKQKLPKEKLLKLLLQKQRDQKQRNHQKLLSKQFPDQRRSRRFHLNQRQRTSYLVMIFYAKLLGQQS